MSKLFSKLDGVNGFAALQCVYILNCDPCYKIDLQSSYNNFNSHRQNREIFLSTYSHPFFKLVKFYSLFTILCVNILSIISESFIDKIEFFVYCFILRF